MLEYLLINALREQGFDSWFWEIYISNRFEDILCFDIIYRKRIEIME